jgi:Mlc titration factor MtfA (ptsG expression regulator)
MWSFLTKRARRQKLIEQPLSDAWRDILHRNVAVYARLSAAEQQRLAGTVQVLAAERSFAGLRGLAMTDEISVTIAGQAALLLLGEDGYFFDRVRTIFVEPQFVRTKVAHSLGAAMPFAEEAVLVEEGVLADGQAFSQGEIRLAWNEVVYGGRGASDGENVVLHEFAHHLDSLDGEIDGIPPLATDEQRRQWMRVFDRELATLRGELAAGSRTFLHAEAAENRAELLAYATECFFEQPRELEELHDELFACLLGFYKVDPRPWAGSNEAF